MAGNVSISKTPNGVARRKTLAYDEYISWRALGGMLVSETGAISQMTLKQFCERYNVNERTTWRWSAEPGLEDKIAARLDEIIPRSRTIAALNRLFLIGTSSLGPSAPHHDQRAAVDALTKYLGHYGHMRTPVQRQEVKVEGNFLDMMAAANQQGIIEGEVVDASLEPQTDTGGSDQDTGALPPAS